MTFINFLTEEERKELEKVTAEIDQTTMLPEGILYKIKVKRIVEKAYIRLENFKKQTN